GIASSSASHAFRWVSGTMSDLGTLGGSQSQAMGINDQGKIVGDAYTAAVEDHAFVWSSGTMTDLNTLIPVNSGWTLIAARDINNNGQIVGYGLINGALRGFLLNPVAAATGWINPAGGNWQTASNWSGNAVPTASDPALFDLNSAGGYTVTASADAQASV